MIYWLIDNLIQQRLLLKVNIIEQAAFQIAAGS